MACCQKKAADELSKLMLSWCAQERAAMLSPVLVKGLLVDMSSSPTLAGRGSCHRCIMEAKVSGLLQDKFVHVYWSHRQGVEEPVPIINLIMSYLCEGNASCGGNEALLEQPDQCSKGDGGAQCCVDEDLPARGSSTYIEVLCWQWERVDLAPICHPWQEVWWYERWFEGKGQGEVQISGVVGQIHNCSNGLGGMTNARRGASSRQIQLSIQALAISIFDIKTRPRVGSTRVLWHRICWRLQPNCITSGGA
eukprot:15365458-Ditylum_brightwellii.AAC.1